MKHDVSFVTCIYDDLANTTFGGQNNRGTHYAFSLAQMHMMGAPIYCYTDKINMYRYFPAFLKYGHELFRFINYNLEESPYYDRIQTVKQAKPDQYVTPFAWSSRCVEIMWGKFDWLIDTSERIGLNGTKYLYWIDAGLSHPGVIPKRFNTMKDNVKFANASQEYSYMFKNNLIFNEKFPDFLAEYTGVGKLLHFICTHPQHNDESHLKLPSKTYGGTVVGGLFGGDITLIREWAIRGKAICDELLSNQFLVKEEDILSYLINYHSVEDDGFKGKMTNHMFDTWYHEDWEGVYNTNQRSFSSFFDEFIEYGKGK